ncbi:zinc ribbon domain-containing protein [Oxalobacter sp. OttesenSCG-928-P03]|nr:zinc ribbon domain-containing protein [Oxalobacter sp. OttesenSCG-928-P03]
MKPAFCQSCCMPMTKPDDHGSNPDKTPSADYCRYCFQNGAFTREMDMEEMIEHCLKFLDEYNKGAEETLSREDAAKQMRHVFPQLKRWSAT